MRRLGLSIMALLAIGVAGYAIQTYLLAPAWPLQDAAMRANFASHRASVLTHIVASSVALLIGPFQFSAALRRRARLHRSLGKCYLAAVALGGASGLLMATRSTAGQVAVLGFGLLALAWLGSAVLAYSAARQRDFCAHRRWMIRNYALTFAAVTLRLYLPASIVAGIPFASAYPVIAWAAWIPNLLVAEALIRASVSRPA